MSPSSARAASVSSTVTPRSETRPISRATWRSTIEESCSRVSGSNSTMSSRRLMNSGLKCGSTPARAPVQPLLHVDQLLDLALEHPRHRDARPLGHDLGDLVGVDTLGQVDRRLDFVVRPRLGLRELLLELRDLAVAQLGGALVVELALGALELHARGVEPLAQLAMALGLRLLALPLGLHARELLAQVGQLALDLPAPLDRGLVALDGDQLDLELLDAAVDLVDLGRHRRDLDRDARGGLVDQVDRLVGQEAVGDVAMRERRGGDQRGVRDRDLVVRLVALLQAAQDRDRGLDARLADVDRLEAALERGVILDV